VKLAVVDVTLPSHNCNGPVSVITETVYTPLGPASPSLAPHDTGIVPVVT
jgi:hypothetical protein